MEPPDYDGSYEDGFFEGRGTLKFPDGRGSYVGEFSRGQFHGEGVLYVKGGSFQGRWTKGKLSSGQFVFDDGLAYKKPNQKAWDYCSKTDPRFFGEIKGGVKKGSKLPFKSANMDNFALVPSGCYDTIDGYFNPKKSSIFDYKSGEELRVVHKEERDWIIENCRIAE